jgi:acetyl-CoA carboxylase alpha subunit
MAEADFEAPLTALQKRIDELQQWPGDRAKEQEARRLRRELDAARREVYANLTPWQKTLVARPQPYTWTVRRSFRWTESTATVLRRRPATCAAALYDRRCA